MNLAEVNSGQTVKIEEVHDPEVRHHLLRLGILEGSQVQCIQRLGHGPVVIRKDGMDLSLGHRLAERIVVSPVRVDP